MYSVTIPFVMAIMLASSFPVITAESFLDPVKGDTPQAQIQCYGLPYGGLGFASHIITYFTVVCLWLRRDPLLPWKKICHPWRSFYMGLVSLILSVGFAVFTIVRCASTWQFVTIAVWKVALSTFLGCSTMSTALSVRPLPGRGAFRPVNQSETRPGYDAADDINLLLFNRYQGDQPAPDAIQQRGRQQDDLRENNSPLWLFLYAAGLIVGLAGLFSLTKANWQNHTIRLITYIMWGVPGGIVGLVGLCIACGVGDSFGERAGITFLALLAGGVTGFGVIAALYSDWVLAAIAGNYSGVPSGDNAILYYGYFLAKRIPLFVH
jgi:hypothetical protein